MRHPQQIGFGELQIGVRHIVGYSHQALPQLLGSIHLQQLASQNCQVRSECAVAREVGKVRRLGGRRLALALLLVGVAWVLGTQLVGLGGFHDAGQHVDLGLGANLVQELGFSILDGLRDVAHGPCLGLLGSCCRQGCTGESSPARGIGLAIPAFFLIGLLFELVCHGSQALDSRLSTIILESVAPLLHLVLCGCLVATGQRQEGVCAGAILELKSRGCAAATEGRIPAAQFFGAGQNGLVILRAQAVGQLHHEQVIAVSGVLGGNHLPASGLTCGAHAVFHGALAGLACIPGAFGCQGVVSDSLLWRQG